MTRTSSPPPPTPDDVAAAQARIRHYVHRTPIFTSRHFDARCQAELFFKAENLQKIGAFKFRGACNALLCLEANELKRGVIAHSSGNHAQAVACAALLRDTHATIVMPEDSARVKIAAVRAYGAQVVLCEATSKAREYETRRLQAETGAILVHPFNDPLIIAGQGTAARELLAEVPDLDLIIAPIGGGGLLSGTALATLDGSSHIEVFGAEPEAADDAARSFESGHIVHHEAPQTVADGLRTAAVGEIPFAIIREHVDCILTVSEEAIVTAMREVWMRMKLVIEPSAAVVVAALCREDLDWSGRRIGVILSGGNVDLDALPW